MTYPNNDLTVRNTGLGRSYFLRRLAADMRQLIDREHNAREEPQEEMMLRVDVEESINQLKNCPICGAELERSGMGMRCECGDFVITAVWADGAVEFTFTAHPMVSQEQPPEEIQPPEQMP
jgi:hypothetical protein